MTEKNVCSSGIHRDESQLFGPSNTKTSDRRVSVRRAQADCNSEGQDSEFSVDDLAVEVDRILAVCDNTNASLNRTSYKMPKPVGLQYAKGQDSDNVTLYSGGTRDKNEMNTFIHEKVGLLLIFKSYWNAKGLSFSVWSMAVATRIND